MGRSCEPSDVSGVGVCSKAEEEDAVTRIVDPGAQKWDARRWLKLSVAVSVAAGSLTGFTPRASAATETWTGATDNTWATGTNWSGTNTPPITGDSLLFSSATSPTGPNLNNNLTSAAFSVAGITFDATAPAFVIGNGTTTANVGNTFVLTGDVTNSSSNLQTINDPFSTTAARTFNLTTGGGNITLGGVVSGAGGGIATAGAGTLTLLQANTYTAGGTTIGTGTTVSTGVAGGLSVNTAPAAVNGTLNLTASTAAINYTFGTLTGAGTINLTTPGGSNTVKLNSGNVTAGYSTGFTGTLNVGAGSTAGKLQLDNPLAAGATINVLTNSTLFIAQAATFPTPITLNGGTTGEAFGQLRVESGAVVSGNVTLAANTTIGAAGTVAGTISGNIVDTGGAPTLTRVGTGTTVLSGTNTYTGPTTVAGGTLEFAKPVSLYNGNTASWTNTNVTANSGTTVAFNVGGPNDFSVAQAQTVFGNLSTGINNNGLRSGSNFGLDTTNATATVVYNTALTNSAGTGSGAVGLNKLGAGTLQLTATNTYTGATFGQRRHVDGRRRRQRLAGQHRRQRQHGRHPHPEQGVGGQPEHGHERGRHHHRDRDQRDQRHGGPHPQRGHDHPLARQQLFGDDCPQRRRPGPR